MTQGRATSSEADRARQEALRLKRVRKPLGASGKIARAFLESKLTPLLVVASLLLGAFASSPRSRKRFTRSRTSTTSTRPPSRRAA